jgi:hypothetical protein
VYTLPSSHTFSSKDEVGVARFTMYNCAFNITPERGNTTITIDWPALIPTTHVITLPPGHFSIPEIAYATDHYCLANGIYMTDNTTGDPANFHPQIVINAPRYAAQISCYALPTDETSEYRCGSWRAAPEGSHRILSEFLKIWPYAARNGRTAWALVSEILEENREGYEKVVGEALWRNAHDALLLYILRCNAPYESCL